MHGKSFFITILLLLYSINIMAIPIWFNKDIKPIAGINSDIIISSIFSKKPKKILLTLSKLKSEQDKKGIEIYRHILDKSSRSKTIKCEFSTISVECNLLIFLPIGNYRAEISDLAFPNKTKERKISVDHINWIISQIISQKKLIKKYGEPMIISNKGHSSSRKFYGKIKPNIVKIKNKKPKFSWNYKKEKDGEELKYFIYLFDLKGLIWFDSTSKLFLDYSGPELPQGKTYFWVVGARSEKGLIEFEGDIPSFFIH